MKVYIVIGNNCESYEGNYSWNDAVFASKEAAERYIQNQPMIYEGEQRRIEELEDKIYYNIDELSDED